MKSAVIVFPGSNREGDVVRALKSAGSQVEKVWHAETELPKGTDLVVLPGGFSYGDYLRCGAIAGRAAAMDAVRAHAARGGLVLGICNGFQILCEAHLLPGSMIKNETRTFVCREQELTVVNADTAWTRDFAPGQRITIPLKNQDGQFVADERTLDQLEAENRVVFRYEGADPNGSRRRIAGIANEAGNVVGLMPHPEHAVEDLTGPSTDGLGFFTSALKSLTDA